MGLMRWRTTEQITQQIIQITHSGTHWATGQEEEALLQHAGHCVQTACACLPPIAKSPGQGESNPCCRSG